MLLKGLPKKVKNLNMRKDHEWLIYTQAPKKTQKTENQAVHLEEVWFKFTLHFNQIY